MIRGVVPADIPKLTPLMAELGYPTTGGDLAERVTAVLESRDDTILVAEVDGELQGLVSVHSFEMLHRPGRLGRITALIVSANARSRGVGTQLLEAAESHLRGRGCIKLEVTSGEQRTGAHGFYAARGYVEQRVHFVKSTVG